MADEKFKKGDIVRHVGVGGGVYRVAGTPSTVMVHTQTPTGEPRWEDGYAYRSCGYGRVLFVRTQADFEARFALVGEAPKSAFGRALARLSDFWSRL